MDFLINGLKEEVPSNCKTSTSLPKTSHTYSGKYFLWSVLEWDTTKGKKVKFHYKVFCKDFWGA